MSSVVRFLFLLSASLTLVGCASLLKVTPEDARALVEAQQRIQYLGVVLNDSLVTDGEKQYAASYPFVVSAVPPALIEALGWRGEGYPRVVAITYPDLLKDSKVLLGDEVLSIDGVSVAGKEELKEAPEGLKPGDEVLVKFRRNEQEWEEKLPLAKRAQPAYRFSLDPTINEAAQAATDSRGNIVVTYSMTYYAATDDELASVLAHEMAHIQLKHYKNAGMQALGKSVVSGVVGALAYSPSNPNAGRVAGDRLGTWSVAPFSQKTERQADILSIRLLREADFDPSGAISLEYKFKEREDVVPGWAKIYMMPYKSFSHPNTSKRIDCMIEEINRLDAESKASDPDKAPVKSERPHRWKTADLTKRYLPAKASDEGIEPDAKAPTLAVQANTD